MGLGISELLYRKGSQSKIHIYVMLCYKERRTDLSGFTTTSFADQDEGLIGFQDLQELLLLVPNRESLPLLQDLIVPLGVGPAGPAIDGRGHGGVVGLKRGTNTVELGDLGGGVVHDVEQTHLSLPLGSHQSNPQPPCCRRRRRRMADDAYRGRRLVFGKFATSRNAEENRGD